MACYDWYIIKVMSIVDSCENDITLSTICYVSNCKNWENYYVPSVYFVTILTYLTHMIDLKIWHLHAIFHQTKTLIGFWYRQDSNLSNLFDNKRFY